MSTLKVAAIKNESSSSNNIVLNADGTVSMSATTISAASVTATGTVSGATVTSTGTVSGATVTSSGDVNDTVGDVRTPRYSAFTSGSATNETITNEGVYNINSAAPTTTLTLGAPAAGTVMCIYNNKGSSVTLAAGSTITAMRKGADNDNTHNATLTLGAYSLTTITIVLSVRAIVTGTDVT